jgi:hypothetical protein
MPGTCDGMHKDGDTCLHQLPHGVDKARPDLLADAATQADGAALQNGAATEAPRSSVTWLSSHTPHPVLRFVLSLCAPDIARLSWQSHPSPAREASSLSPCCKTAVTASAACDQLLVHSGKPRARLTAP